MFGIWPKLLRNFGAPFNRIAEKATRKCEWDLHCTLYIGLHETDRLAWLNDQF